MNGPIIAAINILTSLEKELSSAYDDEYPKK